VNNICLFFILLFLFSECILNKREAKKGFGDEIPKQVWAAAQWISCIINQDKIE